MYINFEQDGVLHIRPQSHADAMVLKWFMKEFAIHGAKMINVETDFDGGGNRAQEYDGGSSSSPYGYSNVHGIQPRYDTQSRYDNNVRNESPFSRNAIGDYGRSESDTNNRRR